MSKLPSDPLPTDTVTVAGTEVAIRSLSRSEAIRLKDFEGREDEAEAYIISCSADLSVEEAAEWLGSVGIETGGALLDAILMLSGLMADPRKGSPGTSRRASSEP